MFGGRIGWMELVIVLAIALLIFGPGKLAEIGKGLGEGIRGFKSSLKENSEEASEKKP
jgi:sec-independent protein translocase protein TatA